MSGQKERCNRRVISSSDGNDEIQVNERMALSEQGEKELYFPCIAI